MKILVTTICFINHAKLQDGSDIYATFANRLISDVINKTDFDIRVATNEPTYFTEAVNSNPDRVSLLVNKLDKHAVAVGAFNQLLKFFALRDIPEQYDWIIYLDCDAGFSGETSTTAVEEMLNRNYSLSDEMPQYHDWSPDKDVIYAVRTNCIVKSEMESYEKTGKNLFGVKFKYYGWTLENLDPRYADASMPSEHFLMVKNVPEKVAAMSAKIEEFNSILEQQLDITYNPSAYISTISDMEAFEIGVSAKHAGFDMIGIDNDLYYGTLKIEFNGNNWERMKL